MTQDEEKLRDLTRKIALFTEVHDKQLVEYHKWNDPENDKLISKIEYKLVTKIDQLHEKHQNIISDKMDRQKENLNINNISYIETCEEDNTVRINVCNDIIQYLSELEKEEENEIVKSYILFKKEYYKNNIKIYTTRLEASAIEKQVLGACSAAY